MPGIQKLRGSTSASQKPKVLSEVQGHSLLNSKYKTNLKYIKSCLRKRGGDIYKERRRKTQETVVLNKRSWTEFQHQSLPAPSAISVYIRNSGEGIQIPQLIGVEAKARIHISWLPKLLKPAPNEQGVHRGSTLLAHTLHLHRQPKSSLHSA